MYDVGKNGSHSDHVDDIWVDESRGDCSNGGVISYPGT